MSFIIRVCLRIGLWMRGGLFEGVIFIGVVLGIKDPQKYSIVGKCAFTVLAQHVQSEITVSSFTKLSCVSLTPPLQSF